MERPPLVEGWVSSYPCLDRDKSGRLETDPISSRATLHAQLEPLPKMARAVLYSFVGGQ